MISSLGQMVDKVLSSGKRYRVAVAWAHDKNSVAALYRASRDGFIEPVMIGIPERINDICKSLSLDPALFSVIPAVSET
ncbi:MAG TPA: hypothetical protein VK861_02805, partial [Bacteroidales bacterium]|nr:hypothetical protein [Bacteroidales bacterium]